jgi:hypothetical protein
MLFAIGFAVAAENIRHFQLRAIQGAWWLEVLRWSRLDLHRNGTRQQIQWARCRAHFAGRDVQIFCCGGQDSVFRVRGFTLRMKPHASSVWRRGEARR